jgi:hypothetical protein
MPRGVPRIGSHTRTMSVEHHVEPLQGKLQAEQLHFP